MKLIKLLILPALLFFHIHLSLTASSELSIYTADAYPAIEAIQKMAEIRKLIDEVQHDGDIAVRVESMPHENFDAFWDGDNRLIKINAVYNKTLGRMIGSLLFELHNARSNDHLQRLCDLASNNLIGIEEFVMKVEKMEHQNALQTSRLIEKGIAKGIFPNDARWPVFPNFDDHYKVQQLHGHSQWIAKHYKQINPFSFARDRYVGTIEGLSQLSEPDKKDMLKYLAIKNDLENPLPDLRQKGFKELNEEYRKIENCFLGKGGGDCARASRRATLLAAVFKGNSSFETLTKDSSIYAAL